LELENLLGIARTARTPTLAALILLVSSLLFAKKQKSRMGGRKEIRIRYTVRVFRVVEPKVRCG
jgi:hypothetical protein